MQKTFTTKTIAAIIITIMALTMHYLQYPAITKTLLILAFALSTVDAVKVSAPLHFINNWTMVTILGLVLDYPFDGHFPYLTLSLFLSFISLLGRCYWIKTLNYSKYLWIEAINTPIFIGLYIIGNLVHPIGWSGWIFPALVLLPSTYMGTSVVIDGMRLIRSGKASPLAEVGRVAPDFTLPDQDGTDVTLSQFKNDRHLLLIFVKGDWCPACHMMLRTYQKEKDKLADKNIMTIAVGPDPVGVNREMVSKLSIDYKVLSDDKHIASNQYGLPIFQEGLNNQENGFALPASFLVDKNGIIRYTSRPDRVGEFLNPSLIFPIVESLA